MQLLWDATQFEMHFHFHRADEIDFNKNLWFSLNNTESITRLIFNVLHTQFYFDQAKDVQSSHNKKCTMDQILYRKNGETRCVNSNCFLLVSNIAMGLRMICTWNIWRLFYVSMIAIDIVTVLNLTFLISIKSIKIFKILLGKNLQRILVWWRRIWQWSHSTLNVQHRVSKKYWK